MTSTIKSATLNDQQSGAEPPSPALLQREWRWETDRVVDDGGPGSDRPWCAVPAPADPATVTWRAADAEETARANRRWWDTDADDYQERHRDFLGDVSFLWGPEGLREEDARLLGDVAGKQIVEIGCGGGQCGRWLVSRGANAVGMDLSWRQLQNSQRLDRQSGNSLPVVQGDAQRLPFSSGAFDIAFSAGGAMAFVADAPAFLSEVGRVLRPGGRFVFAVTHPARWSFLDQPDHNGLVAVHSYFDRRAYVEQDDRGEASYVEHHRTIGDLVRLIAASNFQILDLVEPEWPDGFDRSWGGWSPLRGRIIPGTAIFACRKS
ncbi:class I SAM-dependent methyltransferase [Dactylosporangium sp. NPDC051485]|uniref:class I SAM-dependent methyltransferase n=1 Tax=Dactylosporangium sp. NPDC051485 TaxID=3154846 RepID=UPI003438162D